MWLSGWELRSVCLVRAQVVTQERQKLEDEVAANKNTQNTVSKAVRNLNKVSPDWD
jgi:hypothetical protein